MADAQPPPVTLDAAAPNDVTLLGDLMELYIHDLSAVFPDVMLGPDGRFGYPKLPLYWSEPDRRFPFLIRCDSRVAEANRAGLSFWEGVMRESSLGHVATSTRPGRPAPWRVYSFDSTTRAR